MALKSIFRGALPFKHKPKEPDNTLAAKLRNEYPAILRWMIDDCLDWQKNGLVRPDVVINATAEYFTEQDLLGRWIAEKCNCGVGCQEGATKLYTSWREFAITNGEEPGSATAFGSKLSEKDFQKKKSGGNIYLGIRLKPPNQAVTS